MVDYLQEFAQSTLEKWQSEFLQLFSFVVLASLLIHRGSAESKDSDDPMEAALKRIEESLALHWMRALFPLLFGFGEDVVAEVDRKHEGADQPRN